MRASTEPASASRDLTPLLSAKEAAQLLNVSERTLWTLTNAGKVRHVRIGRTIRYTADEIRRFIARQTR